MRILKEGLDVRTHRSALIAVAFLENTLSGQQIIGVSLKLKSLSLTAREVLLFYNCTKDNVGKMIPKAHIYTVREITDYIKGTLEEDEKLQNVWVKGEISNFKPPSRHLYFSLKDEGGLLSCIMFHDKLKKLRFDLDNGLEVIVRGSIGVYKPQGRYQLYIEEILPVGKGLLYLNFERLKEELREKGYFQPEHKLPLPYLPQRIGIVTSPNGAAIRDILTVLNERFLNLEIIIAPCRVQGDEAPEEIGRAITDLNQYGRVDVIIVGRGGGSFEDLFAFNERKVAEAIYNSHIPIISAVGHEIDVTIADFVADERAPTPSAAAQRVVPRKEELKSKLQDRKSELSFLIKKKEQLLCSDVEKFKKSLKREHPQRKIRDLTQQVDDFRKNLGDYITHQFQLRKSYLSHLEQSFIRLSPRKRYTLEREKLKEKGEKIGSTMKAKLEKMKEKINSCAHRVGDLSPLSILERGYSICFRYPEGKIVREYQQVRKGEKIRVKLHRGHLLGEVYKAEEGKSEI